MKIVQINTSDNQGGAARAAYRLHRGLIHIGQDSQLLCRQKVLPEPSTILVPLEHQRSRASATDKEIALAAIQTHYINLNRTPLSNTLFSLPYPGLDLSYLPQIQQADVLNLHWVATFQSPITIRKLLSLGKPVVWTLHDTWAFTGGCHYSAGCTRYQNDCSACPQLVDNPYDLAAIILQDKLECFREHRLTIVAPSQWLAHCARQSKLFQQQRVEVIPYSLEVDNIFLPWNKAETKHQLGIPTDTITLLFGSETAVEARKGFAELVAAMEDCLFDRSFQQLVSADKVRLLCFGQPSKLLTSLKVPVQSVGSIDSNTQLSQIYAAADLFILPSLEDNLPNTMLEAMSCGTPVIAFAVGGIPDVITDQVTGRIVPVRDNQKLGQAILDCIFDSNHRQQMGQAARQLMEQEYGIEKQANQYLNLYQEILGSQAVSLTSFTPQPSLSAPVETAVGQQFAKIFTPISLQAVTAEIRGIELESAAQIAMLQSIAEERLALVDRQQKINEERLNLIDQLQQIAEERLGLINQLNQIVEERLNQISQSNQQVNQLTIELQRSQKEQECITQASKQTVNRLKQKIGWSKQQIDRLQQERAQAHQKIEQLEQQVSLLSTGRGALKILWIKALQRLEMLLRPSNEKKNGS